MPLDRWGLDQTVPFAQFVAIFVALASIAVCWWALQCVKFDKFVNQPGSPQAKMLHLVMAVVLGYHFARFLLDYFSWATGFRWYF